MHGGSCGHRGRVSRGPWGLFEHGSAWAQWGGQACKKAVAHGQAPFCGICGGRRNGWQLCEPGRSPSNKGRTRARRVSCLRIQPPAHHQCHVLGRRRRPTNRTSSPKSATTSFGAGRKWRYILACRGPFLGWHLPRDPAYNTGTAGYGGGEFVELASVRK